MPLRVLRQIFSVLLVVAYVSATIVAVAPATKAAPAMAGGMAHAMMTPMDNGADGTMPMPCKSMKPGGCVTDAGCIFMLSLPTPHLDIGTPLTWAFVNFPMVAETVPGHSIKPLLGPPISRA
jgi:hypothetical protein